MDFSVFKDAKAPVVFALSTDKFGAKIGLLVYPDGRLFLSVPGQAIQMSVDGVTRLSSALVGALLGIVVAGFAKQRPVPSRHPPVPPDLEKQGLDDPRPSPGSGKKVRH